MRLALEMIVVSALTFVAAAGTAAAVENAAAIGYETIEVEEADRPALPDGVSFEALRLHTIDGEENAAGLWRPDSASADEETVVIAIHGSGGSHLANPVGGLAGELASRGIAVLATDTRQHGDRVNTDNFFDIARDIDAAVHTARSMGFERIVLAGHSLGNIQVQFYAATNWDDDIKGVALLSMFADLPWKSRNILIGNADNYDRLTDEALAAVRAGTPDAQLATEMGYVGGTNVPVTAQHFLTYRREDVSSADGTYWIRRVPQPILLLRDAGDAVALGFETNMLVSASQEEASLSRESVTNVVIPNDEAPSPAAHGFASSLPKAADAVAEWIRQFR